jgi:hypothetical protein
VFVEGRQVPFTGTDSPPDGQPSAYYVHGRTDHLNLPIEAPARVTVVHHAPSVALALAWSRLAEHPMSLFVPLLLLGAAGLAVLRSRSDVWTPRISLSVGVGLVTLWLVSGAHLRPWAPVVLLVELLALCGLLLSARPDRG